MNERSSPGKLAAYWPYALILVVGLFILLPRLGSFGFWDPWEPKYAQSAREMIERDSYIVPYYREEVRLTKPILVYWGVIAGAAVFGLNELGARIGGVCMGILSMLAVFYGVSILRGRRAGLLSALVLGTCPLFYFLARQATPDVYLFTSLGSGLVLLCLGLFGPDRRRDLHFAGSYACLSLAILAKGPIVSGAIFFVPLVLYAMTRIDFRQLWEPDVRPATGRLLLAGLPATILLSLFSATAFLYGTTPDWWSYRSGKRREIAEVRRQLLAGLNRFHAADIVLVALAILGGTTLFVQLRRGVERSRTSLAVTVLAGVLTVGSLSALFVTSSSSKVLTTSLLGIGACLVTLIVAVSSWVTEPRLRELLAPYLRPFGRQLLIFVGVLLVVAGPWHIAIFIKQTHGYLTDFIIKHNFERFGEKINSTGISDFYLRALIFGLFPWSGMIPVAVAGAVAWWDRNPLKRYNLEAYMLISCAVIYVSFSAAVTKFSYYLAPMLIPLAVLIGVTLSRLLDAENRPIFRLALLVSGMLYVIPMLDLVRNGSKYLVGAYTVKRSVPLDLAPGLEFTVVVYAIAGLWVLLALSRSRIVLSALVLAAVLLAHYSATVFIPGLSRHKTMRQLFESWREYGAEDPICFLGPVKHGVFFYSDYEVQLLEGRESFLDFMDPSSPAFCVVKGRDYLRAQPTYRQRFPGHDLHVVDDSHFDYKLLANYAANPNIEPEDRSKVLTFTNPNN